MRPEASAALFNYKQPKGETMKTETLIKVILNSGNFAVYECQPQHIPREDIPQSREWPIMYGNQIAHQSRGQWFKCGGWQEITEPKTLKLLNNL
jgi:hypothetical protein